MNTTIYLPALLRALACALLLAFAAGCATTRQDAPPTHFEPGRELQVDIFTAVLRERRDINSEAPS